MTSPIIFPNEAAAATQREWEAFGDAPITIGPLTDDPPVRRPLRKIANEHRRLWLLAWALGWLE